MTEFESLRALLSPWGELRPQSAAEWAGDMPLPASVAALYGELGPWGPTVHEAVGPVGLTIHTGGNPVEVPPLHKLWARQAGYRWHGLTGERLPHWRDEWLALATEGSNAFIVDCVSGAVSFNFSGGLPAPRSFAPDLVTALGAIATVANTLACLGDAAFDASFELLPDAREAVVEAVQACVGNRADARHMLAAWEWYC